MTSAEIEARRAELRRIGYGHYLRTGRVPIEIKSVLGEDIAGGYWVKFNPYHDPEDGRFTFTAGHPNAVGNPVISHGRNAVKPPPRPTAPAARPIRQRSLGNLSERQEAPKSGPETISSGRGDPGGKSYGSYQFASRNGSLQKFLSSPDAAPWAEKFRGLTPGTSTFDAQWRTVARSDPEAFQDAQFAYIARTHYDPAVRRVAADTGYDLDNASEAVRQATYSVAVQHGRAALILRDAVLRTDRSVERTNPLYQRALINNIYDRRTEYMQSLRESALKRGDRGAANTYGNDIKGRYPREREEALALLSK